MTIPDNLAELTIIMGGIISLFVAVGHSTFYRLFNWKTEFEKITILNRKVLYTIHIFLTLLFFSFGILSLAYAKELSSGKGLGAGVSLAYGLFWLVRLLWQIIYFRPSAVPHDRKLLLFHCFLIAVFIVLSACYLLPVCKEQL